MKNVNYILFVLMSVFTGAVFAQPITKTVTFKELCRDKGASAKAASNQTVYMYYDGHYYGLINAETVSCRGNYAILSSNKSCTETMLCSDMNVDVLKCK